MSKTYIASWIIKNRIICILFSVLIFVGLTQGTTKLTFNPDMETFFPESHPATALNAEIDETFLPTDNMVIAINGKGESIFNRDYPVIMAITLIGAIAFVIANLVADISYSIIDPRIRYK